MPVRGWFRSKCRQDGICVISRLQERLPIEVGNKCVANVENSKYFIRMMVTNQMLFIKKLKAD
jgi:hypothetical protein